MDGKLSTHSFYTYLVKASYVSDTPGDPRGKTWLLPSRGFECSGVLGVEIRVPTGYYRDVKERKFLQRGWK